MPVVLSPLATSYIWKFIFDFNGPLNLVLRGIGLDSMARAWIADPTWAIWTILVVLVWQNIGFSMVIYMAGLAAVPVEIEEAAASTAPTCGSASARRAPVTLPLAPSARPSRSRPPSGW